MMLQEGDDVYCLAKTQAFDYLDMAVAPHLPPELAGQKITPNDFQAKAALLQRNLFSRLPKQ